MANNKDITIEVLVDSGSSGPRFEDHMSEEGKAGVLAERRRILVFLATSFEHDEEGRETADWIAQFVRSGCQLEDITPERAAEIWKD